MNIDLYKTILYNNNNYLENNYENDFDCSYCDTFEKFILKKNGNKRGVSQQSIKIV